MPKNAIVIDACLGRNTFPPSETSLRSSHSNGVVELIAGEFLNSVLQIWPGHLIGEYLSASDPRRQIWHACLASQRHDLTISSPEASALAVLREQFARHRGANLIVAAYGACPIGLLNVMKRVGPQALKPETYCHLFQILHGGGEKAKYVLHLPKIEDAAIAALAELKDSPDLPKFLAMLRRDKLAPVDLELFRWATERLVGLAGDEAVREIFSSGKPVEALARACLSLPFPPPPWAGTEKLRPVRSLNELHAIGRELNNCLQHDFVRESKVKRVLAGDSYFYLWSGEQKALLQCQRVGKLGWILEAICGLENEDVSRGTRNEIRECVIGFPDLCVSYDCQFVHMIGNSVYDALCLG